jgi:hypothetical protein
VTVLPPGVVHDGRPVSGDGFRKRVLYLETSLLGEHLTGRAVDRPVIRDLTLRRRLSVVHRLLASTDDAFEAETCWSFITERIRLCLSCGHVGCAINRRTGMPRSTSAERSTR